MRVGSLLIVLLISGVAAALAPGASAHNGGCTLALHGYGSDAHLDCGHQGPTCIVDMKDPLLKVSVGCGQAENGNCPAQVRYKSMKVDACMPDL